MGKKAFYLFIYSNLFIAICAVAMVDQTYRLVLDSKTNFYFLFFVFFSTICSYSFHWFLTSHSVIPSPRIEWVNRNRTIHVILFFIGGIGSGIFFLYLLPYWFWLMILGIMTFLYSAPKIPHPIFRALRNVAMGKTIFLALVWTGTTTLLPILISETEWKPAYLLFLLSRFFLVYAICILFDYRDREDDKIDGVHSLITYMNEKGILFVFAFSLVAHATTSILLYNYDYSVLSITLLVIPGIITAGLYNYARKNFNDFFYYFILDGLMALSAFLMLIAFI